MKKLIFILVVLAGCHPVQDASKVDAAVDRFHERLASGDDEAIYQEAGPEYQLSIDPETNRRFIARILRKMGMPGSAHRTSYNVTYNSAGAIVNAAYQVSYTNGDAVETFIWRMKDGKTVLLGFTIDSRLMQTD